MSVINKISFGGFVRDHRLKKDLSLRKFSKAVELSSTFVSRMERDDVNPPSEGKIINIAKILSVDSDRLTLMARKIPEDIQQMLFDKPMLVRVLRVASKKSDAEIERLFRDAWSSISDPSFTGSGQESPKTYLDATSCCKFL